jgi:hypothetical protein
MSDTIIVIAKETETILVSASGPQGASGPGVPAGGTANQLLLKNSGTNYDAGWTTYEGNVHSWNKQQYYTLSTLSIGGGNTIAWDWNTQPEAKIILPHGVTYTLSMPSNRQPGVRTLRAYQDSTGGGILTVNSGYVIDTSIVSPTFVANSFIDLYFKDDGTNITVFGAEYIP